MYISEKDLKEDLRRELVKIGIAKDDIDFILDKIKCSDYEPSFWVTPFNIDRILHERNQNLPHAFHEASKNANINWRETYYEDEDNYLLNRIYK